MPPFIPTTDFDDASTDESLITFSSCHSEEQETEVQTKSVRIDLTLNETNFIISRDEYTDEEIADAWWSEEECDIIRQQCINTLDKLYLGETLDDITDTARGLECHTEQRRIEIQTRRLAHRVAVLTAYKDNISQTARQYSSRCCELAIEQARNDENVLYEYYDDDDDDDDEEYLQGTAFRPMIMCCNIMCITKKWGV